MKFKFLEHTADVKFQAFGSTLEEAFGNCGLAAAKSMFKGKVKKTATRKVKVEGKDEMALLYNFLDEIVYLFDAENFLVSEIKNLKIKGNKLSAEIVGDDAENYEIKEHIKSVTYSEMFVKKEKGRFVVQVVLDV